MEIVAQVAAILGILATGVALVSGMQALRKETVLRNKFDWATTAWQREDHRIIKAQLDMVREKYFEELMAVQEYPIGRMVPYFVGIPLGVAIGFMTGLHNDAQWFAIPGLASLAVTFVCVWSGVSMLLNLIDDRKENQLNTRLDTHFVRPDREAVQDIESFKAGLWRYRAVRSVIYSLAIASLSMVAGALFGMTVIMTATALPYYAVGIGAITALQSAVVSYEHPIERFWRERPYWHRYKSAATYKPPPTRPKERVATFPLRSDGPKSKNREASQTTGMGA